MTPELEIESGVVPGEHQPPSEEQRLRLRLSVLDAYLFAAERRADVIDAVVEARDLEKALRSVADLLGITEQAASAVLEARLRTFSQSEVARIRTETGAIRSLLDRAR
jgi:DNA gyrase/topoisomerase IV subunit A